MRRTRVIRFACCPRDGHKYVRIASKGAPATEELIAAGAKISLGCVYCSRKCERLEIRYAPVIPKEREVEACRGS